MYNISNQNIEIAEQNAKNLIRIANEHYACKQYAQAQSYLTKAIETYLTLAKIDSTHEQIYKPLVEKYLKEGEVLKEFISKTYPKSEARYPEIYDNKEIPKNHILKADSHKHLPLSNPNEITNFHIPKSGTKEGKKPEKSPNYKNQNFNHMENELEKNLNSDSKKNNFKKESKNNKQNDKIKIPRPTTPVHKNLQIEENKQKDKIHTNFHNPKIHNPINQEDNKYEVKKDIGVKGPFKKEIKKISGKNVSAKKNSKEEDYSGIEKELIERIEETLLEKDLKVSLNDIIGMKDVKDKLFETIILPRIRPDLFQGLLSPTKGILLYGPPGNGKTLIAKAIASESKEFSFFNISSSSLASKWFGESEKLMKALFLVANKKSPAIIFIDEIDSILTRRSERDNDGSKKVKTEFLVQMDGVIGIKNGQVLIIGATNRPYDLDDAALRRFPSRIYVGLPEAEARMSLVNNAMKDYKLKLSNKDWELFCKKTDGYSFADLFSLCKETVFIKMRKHTKESIYVKPACELITDITIDDFIEALKKVAPSVSEKTIIEFKQWESKNKVE